MSLFSFPQHHLPSPGTSPVFILVDEPENAFQVNGPAQGPVLTCNGHTYLSHPGPCWRSYLCRAVGGKDRCFLTGEVNIMTVMTSVHKAVNHKRHTAECVDRTSWSLKDENEWDYTLTRCTCWDTCSGGYPSLGAKGAHFLKWQVCVWSPVAVAITYHENVTDLSVWTSPIYLKTSLKQADLQYYIIFRCIT